jgi:cytochrome c-type biogenesis protein CcmE
MDEEQRMRRQVSNVVLFGVTECNGMVLTPLNNPITYHRTPKIVFFLLPIKF